MTTLTLTRRAAIAERSRSIQHRHERRIVPLLQAFFRQQARRVVERWLSRNITFEKVGPFYVEHKTAIAVLFPASEDEALVQLLIRLLTPMVTASSDLASTLVGLPPLPPTDPKLLAILARQGYRIRRISEETRAAIQQVLVDGASAGYSDYQVAYGVPADDFRGLQAVVEETYQGRAQTIARTETAVASALSAGDRWVSAGVTEADCIDGDDCGLDGHDDPEKPNGKRYPVEMIEQYPTSHPNCVRVWLPVIESRE